MSKRKKKNIVPNDKKKKIIELSVFIIKPEI
jgi:hypothetical protein